jgi:hypothetical protein
MSTSAKCLLAKQPANSPQDAVFLRVIWVVFAWDFEDGGERSCVGIDPMAYPVSNLFSPYQQPPSLMPELNRP